MWVGLALVRKLLLLLGSAGVCGGGLISDSLKKERKKVVTATACLKQKAWLLSVGWKFFFAIKEASQFCLTFNFELSFKKVCTC